MNQIPDVATKSKQHQTVQPLSVILSPPCQIIFLTKFPPLIITTTPYGPAAASAKWGQEAALGGGDGGQLVEGGPAGEVEDGQVGANVAGEP